MLLFHKSVERLFSLYPLVPVAVCLVAGIACGHFGLGGLEAWLSLALAGAALVGAAVLAKFRKLCSCLLLLSFFFLGVALAERAEKEARCSLPVGVGIYRGVVGSEPVVTDRYARADIVLVDGPLRGRTVRTYLKGNRVGECPTVGEGVAFRARLFHAKGLGDGHFNYPLYLRSHGIVATATAYEGGWGRAETDLRALSAMQRVRLWALRLRHRLVGRYKSLGLAGDALAVASAMTLGDKSAIDAELRQTYAATGTSHILALSGMHLGIIYSLLLFLSLGRGHGVVRTLLLLSAVWAFVLLVGLSPSVVRAAVMLSVCTVVSLSTRQYASLNTLAFTAVAMLVASPLSLFDVGFQLSFVAVAAIVMFGVPLGEWLPRRFMQRHPLLRYAWQLAVMSTVAQVATAPLSIYYFGQTSLYFLPANFVVIPTATVILYAAVAVFAFSPLAPLCQLAATVLGLAATMLNQVLASIASLPGACLSGIHISTLQLVVLQALAFALLWAVAIISSLWPRHRDEGFL